MNNLCEFLDEEPPINLRKCIKCGELKSLENFGFRTKKEQRNDCKDCIKIQQKKLKLIKKYNPLPDLNTYKCPHCHRTQKEIYETGSWVNTKKKTCFIPDHNHNTGKFRGYICEDCNTVIARSKENIQTLKNIANFLEKNNKQDLEL